MSKFRVSLYIPCYNVEKYIGKCLEAVLKQRYPIDEVLVIDDGSTDATVEIASKYPVKIIRHSTNRGLAAARNTAIKAARSEFIASLDADCIPQPTWLEKLMENFSDSEVAGVGGNLVEKYVDPPDKWRSIHLKQKGEEQKSVNSLAGDNCVFRRSVLKEVGPYNEKYKTNFEDHDICRRIRKRGYLLIYTPRAVVTHLCKDTISSVLVRAWRYNFAYRLVVDGFSKVISRYIYDIGCAFHYLAKDLCHGEYDLLQIDLWLPFEWLSQDWKNFLMTKKELLPQGETYVPPLPQALLDYLRRFLSR